MSDKLLKILAVPIMWVLLMIVFPATFNRRAS
jgi:hypothetical protein